MASPALSSSNAKNPSSSNSPTGPFTTRREPRQRHPASLTCPLCSKIFTRSYNLRSHLRTHNDERPFTCSVCGRAFARQHDRKRHERLHRGEQQFLCGGELKGSASKQWGCGRAFARFEPFARHLRSSLGRSCIKPLFDQEKAQQRPAFISTMTPIITPTMASEQHPRRCATNGASATTSMDVDACTLWPLPDPAPYWSSLAPLSGAPLPQWPASATMNCSPSPSADPFADMESLFDFESTTTSTEDARTIGFGAYTNWWRSYTSAVRGMKANEHNEDPDRG
ncbi:c2h2 type zinc finger domain-containing protein [Purpureocillium lavendulum]|uniref:C2h2 type zinc finger domain-containing protein n=1 Tax=Purpureocillium lavendulum TaxID=1247861 RepID=A0AB34FCF7_9HYPO|nr:c2h2 type zinc finger domain-containing protein [Purpureocillium lavendulum]